jgi:hypothetical protein
MTPRGRFDLSGLSQRWQLPAAAGFARRLAAHDSAVSVIALLLVLGLSFWAWEPLVAPGLLVTHDGQQALWIYEVDRCFDDGQLPCRWLPDMAFGFGQPLFNYLAPLAYYVGELVHLIGFSIVDSLRIAFILGFLLSGALMFLFARGLWGNWGGALAAVFYVYAPYHALDVYVRGALSEHFAVAFFPGVLWAIQKVLSEGKLHHVLLLALFSTCVVLSHTLMAMILSPAAFLWAGLVIWQTKRIDRAYLLVLAELWALALAAFFVLPVLFERDLIHIEEVATGYFNFRDHFASWDQLFLSRSWGFGVSVPGTGDGMSFQIGWLHWGVAAASLLAAPFLFRARNLPLAALALFFPLFWASVFLTHEWSRFVWDTIPDLKWVQFPWRFLTLTMLMSSLLAGALLSACKGRPWLSLAVFALLTAAVIGLNVEFFRAGGKLSVTDAENFSGERFRQQTSVWGPFYLPIDVGVLPEQHAGPPVEATRGRALVSHLEQGSHSLTFEAEVSDGSGARMRAAVFDFPGWTVRVDGEVVPHTPEDRTGVITFTVPGGTHDVALNLEDTGVREAGNLLSLSAWALFGLVAAGWVARGGRRAIIARSAGRPSPPTTEVVAKKTDAAGQ